MLQAWELNFLMSKVSILQTSYERQNYAFPMFHEIACVVAVKDIIGHRTQFKEK